jgi:hypothetical protein
MIMHTASKKTSIKQKKGANSKPDLVCSIKIRSHHKAFQTKKKMIMQVNQIVCAWNTLTEKTPNKTNKHIKKTLSPFSFFSASLNMKKGYQSVPSFPSEKGVEDFDEKAYSDQSWLNQLKSQAGLFFLSPKQKMTRKTWLKRTRGIRLLSTLVFCTLSMYFIHRFIRNYTQIGKNSFTHLETRTHFFYSCLTFRNCV